MTDNKQRVVRLTIAPSEELHAQLKRIAQQEGRSLVAQILYILRKYVDEYLEKQK